MNNKKLLAIITASICQITQLDSHEFSIKSIDVKGDDCIKRPEKKKNLDQILWNKAGRIELMDSAYSLNQLRL